MAVSTFMQYLAEVVIQITPSAELDPELAPRNLRVTRVSNDHDMELAYRLTVSVGDQPRVSAACWLYRKATASDLLSRPQVAFGGPTGSAPNEASATEPRVLTDESEIQAITRVFDDGAWAYTASRSESWIDPEALACGMQVSLPWSALSFGSSYRTVSDLGLLQHVRVLLPPSFDLTRVDEFHLAFFSSAGSLAALEFEKFRFTQHANDGRWEVRFSGPELFELVSDDYTRWRHKIRSNEST